MFNFYRLKTKKKDLKQGNLDGLKKDLNELKQIEIHLWHLHEKDAIKELTNTINKRRNIIVRITKIINQIQRDIADVLSAVQKHSPIYNVNINQNREYENLFHNIELLEKLVIQQVNFFSKIESREKNQRELGLNGNKILEHESEFSTITKRIIDLIDMCWNKEAYLENNIGYASNDDRQKVIRTKQNTIILKNHELELDRDFTHSGLMTIEEAEDYRGERGTEWNFIDNKLLEEIQTRRRISEENYGFLNIKIYDEIPAEDTPVWTKEDAMRYPTDHGNTKKYVVLARKRDDDLSKIKEKY